jgi:uncharacterized protein YcbX
MKNVGKIQSIWRYPVKGMAGESLVEAEISEAGIVGDRLLAVQDVKRREIQSCKFRPQLLRCKAALEATDRKQCRVNVNFPDGQILADDDARINEKLSELLGHDSVLTTLQPKTNEAFYRRYTGGTKSWLVELKETFEREAGEPLPDLDNMPLEGQHYVTLLGSFFLVSPFHVLTTSSLEYMQATNPSADWNLERFRPNIVIETDGQAGLVEQEWINGSIRIGETVEVDCKEPAPRCGAVTKPQQAFEEDKTVLRSIVKQADQNLGIYGDITSNGKIAVGDWVYFEHA